MQDDDHGVPVRSITTIFSTIPAAFMGMKIYQLDHLETRCYTSNSKIQK